jgi:hypothetical protein
MADLRCTCPQCHTLFQASASLAGTAITCGRCGKRFTFPHMPLPSDPPSSSSLPAVNPFEVRSSQVEYLEVVEESSPDHLGSDNDVRETFSGDEVFARSRAVPEYVSLSAHIIDWPDACASCCGRADTTLYASHTRVQGIKVVRETTKGFRVPHCRRCSHWEELTYLIQEDFSQLAQIEDDIERGESYEEYGFPPLPGEHWVVILLIASFTFGLGALSYFYFRAVHRGECEALISSLPEKRRRWARVRKRIRSRTIERDSLVPPGCEVHAQPVQYQGWHGSVHTFLFKSREYARRFKQLNARKLLRG